MWGGGINNLKNPKNNQKIKISKNIAFSLIELSIVLIIIGLLVAGVTGGASLIQSAKLRALMNEMNGYKQSVNSFYVARGRLPGDINNNGYIGDCLGSGCITSYCPAGTFQEPYDKAGRDQHTCPFVDMYLEKVIDFRPDAVNTNCGAPYGHPYSKIFKNSDYFFYSVGNYEPVSTNYLYNLKNGNVLLYYRDNSSEKMDADTMKKFDEKIDDGIYNSGSFRGYCGNTDYDSAETAKTKCSSAYYRVF